eukprot:GHVL01008767.1.p1 GENE.GHVL01008767.1~~GHVL01008767.1.p1  ORF type:complete len:399 (+),score=43.28 GHVL01008767.1:713-1909(+)
MKDTGVDLSSCLTMLEENCVGHHKIKNKLHVKMLKVALMTLRLFERESSTISPLDASRLNSFNLIGELTKSPKFQFEMIPSKDIAFPSNMDKSSIIKMGHNASVHTGVWRQNSSQEDCQPVIIVFPRMQHRLGRESSLEFASVFDGYARLSHRNIQNCIGFCLDDVHKKGSMILEIPSHGNLFHFLQKKKANLRQILHLALDVAVGMEWLHNQNIIKGLLLPADVGVFQSADDENSYFTKILNLGLTYNNISYIENYRLITEFCPESVRYIAPEVLQGEKQFSCLSDVYSFGVLLWQMITNKIPFKRKTEAQVFASVGWGQTPLPTTGYDKLNILIEACTNPIASARPSFEYVCTYFKGLLQAEDGQMTCKNNEGGDNLSTFYYFFHRAASASPCNRP